MEAINTFVKIYAHKDVSLNVKGRGGDRIKRYTSKGRGWRDRSGKGRRGERDGIMGVERPVAGGRGILLQGRGG